MKICISSLFQYLVLILNTFCPKRDMMLCCVLVLVSIVHILVGFFLSMFFKEEQLDDNNFHSNYLSVYHLKESTLLQEYSAIAEALGEGSMAALFILNYSAVFGAINIPISLTHLQYSFSTKERP